MYDCKVISVKISQGLPFHLVKESRDGNAAVDTYDSPLLENALKPYLREGYRVVQTVRLDGAYYSFLLEKD